MRIVLLGAPGSGKRTQTMLMVERYGIPSIFTGELLRNALAVQSPLGQQLKQAMEEGRSITEEVVLELIRERLQQADARPGFVLDGFPRNILQAITLDELLYEMSLPIELALLVDIETDVLMERLVGRRTCRSCGTQYNIYSNPTAVEGVCDLCGGRLRHRADDNEETVSNRLHVYDHLVSPLIKHYTRQNKLRRIDGNGQVEEVFARICEAVDTHVPPPVQQPLSVYEAAAAMEGHGDERPYAKIPDGGAGRGAVAPGLDLDQILQETENPPPKVKKVVSAARKKVVRAKASSNQTASIQRLKASPTKKKQSASSKVKAKKKAAAKHLQATKKAPVASKAAAKSGKKRTAAARVKQSPKAKPLVMTGAKKAAAKKAVSRKKPSSQKKAVVKQAKQKTAAKKKSAKAGHKLE
jgi:adenylate kinase